MSSDQEFTITGLEEDIKRIGKIADDWQEKMRYLPMDTEYSMYRRAVLHLEKSMKLVEKIIYKFMVEGEE